MRHVRETSPTIISARRWYVHVALAFPLPLPKPENAILRILRLILLIEKGAKLTPSPLAQSTKISEPIHGISFRYTLWLPY